MTTVAVVGLGNWGTALAHHLAVKGCDVLCWSIDPDVVRGVNQTHSNPKSLSEVKLHPGLRATISLEEIKGREFTLLVLPSHALAEVVPRLKLADDTVVVSAIKGMEMKSHKTPLQFAGECLNSGIRLAVLSGPSFARDIVGQRPSGLVAASRDETVARRVAELFTSECMRVYISTDPLGVELGGIVKNIIAIAAGASDGLSLGDSARVGLITRGLAEMVRFAEAMGAERMTMFGLSGLGDLAMTSTSDLSRNRTLGVRLGRGEKLDDIINSLGSVAEGALTAPVILDLADRLGVDMPITYRVVQVLQGKATPQEMVKSLIARPIKREFE